MIKKVLLTILGILGGGIVIIVLTVALVVNKSIPEGEAGPAAEALTDRIEATTALTAWRNTAAVEWRFDRRGNEHFYDKARGLIEVRLPGDEQLKVQYDKRNHKRFVAYAGEQKLEGEAAKAALTEAIKWHVNDLFWLNPFAALRAPGTERKLVGERALLVQYSSGGVTPGDSYLIITDANGRPERWQMWVSILPLKGIEFTFEGWQSYDTGAVLSSIHRGNITDINLSNIKTYATYPVAGETDRFAELLNVE